MDAPPPLTLSALAARLLRRPPSLRELVTLVGYAEDYAWFAGLVRRLFPEEAEAALALPDARERVIRFARLFAQRHFPLYLPYLDFYAEDEDEPPWCWLRRGIPYELMGVGLRGAPRDVGGLPRGNLGPGPPGRAPRGPVDRARGAPRGVAGGPPPHIPRETLARIPVGGIPLDALDAAVAGTGYEAAAQAARWVWAETDVFFLDASYDDGMYDGFADPWDDDLIRAGTAEWRRAEALLDAVGRLADWLEEDLPARFAALLDAVLPRLPRDRKKEVRDHDDGNRERPVVPAGH